MILRCHVDGVLLEAFLRPGPLQLIVVDGEEAFAMEAVEAMFYEVMAATEEELLGLERAAYRLLKNAPDFQLLGWNPTRRVLKEIKRNRDGSRIE